MATNIAQTTQVRIRRGTTELIAGQVVEGEPFYDLDVQRMGIGGGSQGVIEQWKSQFLEHQVDATGSVPVNMREKLTEIVSVKDFGAVGDGVTDDTAAIQTAIDAARDASISVVHFPSGTYILSATVYLRDGVSLVGSRAVITYTESWGSGSAMFIPEAGKPVHSIVISGFKFDGRGEFSATPFVNPYYGGQSVGLTNNHIGVQIAYGSTEVLIKDCSFVGLGKGVYVVLSTDCYLHNCYFFKCGMAGISTDSCNKLNVSMCKFNSIVGNMTANNDTNTANSKFADAIYLHDAHDVTISQCRFNDVQRIGVVLEGAGPSARRTKNVIVDSCVFTLMQACRGTEFNAAMWAEQDRTDGSYVFSNNVCDNSGAIIGSNYTIGILMRDGGLASGNIVTNFGNGIEAVASNVIDNIIRNNEAGIVVYQQAAGSSMLIEGNLIATSHGAGVEFYHCHGLIGFRNNTIIDNGQVTDHEFRKAGVIINRFYTDLTILNVRNDYISNMNSADTHGQKWGIVMIAGGDYSYTHANTRFNNFHFRGTLSASYPSNLSVTPASSMYWNTAPGNYVTVEISSYNSNNNYNSKLNYQGVETTGGGHQIPVGSQTAAPISGTWRHGDVIRNSNPTAGGVMGWVCTVSGTPGTWKSYGQIEP